MSDVFSDPPEGQYLLKLDFNWDIAENRTLISTELYVDPDGSETSVQIRNNDQIQIRLLIRDDYSLTDQPFYCKCKKL